MEPQVRRSVDRYTRELVGRLHGRVLVLGSRADLVDDHAGPAITGRTAWDPGGAPPAGTFDSALSLCVLWQTDELAQVLEALLGALDGDGELVFCEPTVDPLHGSRRPRLRHDITAEMWAAGFSPKDWRRFTVSGEWGIPWPFVRGVARRTRESGELRSR